MVRASRHGRRSSAAPGGRRGRGGATSAHGGHRTVGDDTVGAGRGFGLHRPGVVRAGGAFHQTHRLRGRAADRPGGTASGGGGDAMGRRRH
eukprot:3154930-Pleurochrysis_carterae.AAC.1